MSHKLHDTFPTMKVYVPAVPADGYLGQSIQGLDELDAETTAKITAVVKAGNHLTAHFAANAVTLDELPTLFAPLQHALRSLLAHVQPDYDALIARTNSTSSAETVRWLLPEGSPELHNGYEVCDRYFRFIRVRDMHVREWLGTMAFVSLEVVEDLPHSLLNWDELTSLILALTIQFDWTLPETASLDIADSLGESEPVSPAPPPWRSEVEGVGRTVAISWFRLLAGHHLWQHFSVIAREYFEISAEAFAHGDDEQATETLWKATRIFRATTATMWYASIFPRKTYQVELRPTMVETDSIDAQLQHLTYNLLKQSIKKLKAALDERIQTNRPLRTAQAYAALKEFYEFFVQDMEQHILVATSKVGLDSSLAQKVWQETLPPNTRIKNAMDLLRDMAVLRQKEWQKVLNAITVEQIPEA